MEFIFYPEKSAKFEFSRNIMYNNLQSVDRLHCVTGWASQCATAPERDTVRHETRRHSEKHIELPTEDIKVRQGKRRWIMNDVLIRDVWFFWCHQRCQHSLLIRISCRIIEADFCDRTLPDNLCRSISGFRVSNISQRWKHEHRNVFDPCEGYRFFFHVIILLSWTLWTGTHTRSICVEHIIVNNNIGYGKIAQGNLSSNHWIFLRISYLRGTPASSSEACPITLHHRRKASASLITV